MAAALVDKISRETAPETVERELAAVWRELAHRGAIARAVMSNLVIFRYHERRAHERGGEPVPETATPSVALIESVVARHPSRAIVIEHDRGQHRTAAPMGAVVSVAIFGPPDARYGVESIAVRSACAEASLPSIVRRFARGGLPTSIWWTEDLSTSPLLPSLARMARQFVYDSRCWRDVAAGVQAVTALSADAGTDLADLNWRRLKPLRDLLKHAAAANGRAIRPNQVRIGYARQERALAVLLAGWLASRLEWPIDAPIETGEADGDEILTLAVRDGAFALKGTLNDRRARVEASGSAPLVVAAAPEPEADAVAAELRLLACERDLLDTLRALARRIASGAQL